MDARELTRDEKKKIRSLVTGMCANYDRETSLCLPLDCGCYMLHKCWTGAYCRYFREAVLPLDPELLAALTVEGSSPELRACTVCGRAFLPEGRQAYCSDACKAEGNRRKSRERMRKMREKRPGGGYDLPPRMRAFPGREYCNPSRPGLLPHFVTYHTSGHVGPRYRKEVSLGDRTRLCHFENNYF